MKGVGDKEDDWAAVLRAALGCLLPLRNQVKLLRVLERGGQVV